MRLGKVTNGPESAYRQSKYRCNAVKIVLVCRQLKDSGDDCLSRPVDAKDLGQPPKVVCRGFTDGEHGVSEPLHAERSQLFVKEIDTELLGKERDVLNDGKSHTPLLVFSKLDNSRKKRLGEEFNADD